MPHASPLITILVIGLTLAFLLGLVATRLGISVLVGYLLAGVMVGPFTPGFVADQGLAPQLADVGVILLMFGVGLHFSVKDLLAVRAVALPGSIAQVALSTGAGMGLGLLMGWAVPTALIFGLSLGVASTVVLMRALDEQRLMETERGRLAIGWLVIQDVITVLALVMLPALMPLIKAGSGHAPSLLDLAWTLGLTLGKVAAFVALMLAVGRRVIPAALHYVARTGSRELFRLALLAVALGVAFVASGFFGVSFALGAFVAGMVLSESALSQHAAEETLPLRDAFAVLFFISIGMLFDPSVLLGHPGILLGALAIVLVVTPLIVFAILRLLGTRRQTALTMAAGLAQIGEFSFILTTLGADLGLVDSSIRSLVLAVSILSILMNPLAFMIAGLLAPWAERRDTTRGGPPPDSAAHPAGPPRNHAILVGYGRVGALVADGLLGRHWPLLVIETGDSAVAAARAKGAKAILGNAADPAILAEANIAAARLLVVAVPEAFEAGQVVEQARTANPAITIIARAHFDSAVDHLRQLGADVVIMGEREIAHAMLDYALRDTRAPSPAVPSPTVTFKR
ncbi:YbaL family putative K(+) efflux transporter [Gluconacetobacter sacchari]|uniref:Kef family K(+) transporter n=2 Tax=Gluconacetobacter sacchari TaxID=92759 RepID=A0A7W4NQP6_9PROT|nr:YbaL family putative K(+) efflux transporter [Gluconacetobacter sacchari]MBB2162597.1 Kef family K(+) transporter [Gluconacetobacter sacchari]GBQ22754.1 sodium/hydrogen exchanger [Gluconacetobacter sacchari DSM 12717]